MSSLMRRFSATFGLDAGGLTLTGVGAPVNDTDAATKAFASNASNLTTGTINPALLGTITTYVGTTAIALGRASGAQALTGITSIDGNAATATALQTSRTFSFTGAATGSAVFDGTADATVNLTLADTGVVANTYTKVSVNAKGLITSGSSLSASDIPNLDWSKITTGRPTTLAGYGITDGVNSSLIGAANGIATLDSNGQIPTSQLPAAVVGAMNYQGTWDASTNSPALVSGTGTKGYYYKVSVAGTTNIDGTNDWRVGDMIVFNGTTWDRIDGGKNEVISVFGRTGAVVLTSTDISTALGYTPLSSSGSIQTAVNAGALANAVGGTSFSTQTFSSALSNQVIASASTSTVRSFELLIQVTAGTKYQLSKVLVIHDGTTPTILEYGQMNTNGLFATFDATISGGVLSVVTTTAETSSTYKIVMTTLDV